MRGGEAKGRAPGRLCGAAASPEIKSGVATTLCLGPGDVHREHEFGSHLTKPGATGAAPGAGLEVLPDGPGNPGSGEPHFIQLLRTVFSNKDENQAVPLLCDLV